MIIQLEQARTHLRDIQPDIEELATSLNIDLLKSKCKELEEIASGADFWNAISFQASRREVVISNFQ